MRPALGDRLGVHGEEPEDSVRNLGGDLRDRVQIAVYAYEHGIVRPGQNTPP